MGKRIGRLHGREEEKQSWARGELRESDENVWRMGKLMYDY